MSIFSYLHSGYKGQLVKIETDIRNGLPGIDIVGLPDNSVKESRERVRAAIRRSGFDFPKQRILINLAPADVKKGGAGFDLPIAVSILEASGQLDLGTEKILISGELSLNGKILPTRRGILPVINMGLGVGIKRFLIPESSIKEMTIDKPYTYIELDKLSRLAETLSWKKHISQSIKRNKGNSSYSFHKIKGQSWMKEALITALGGRHNMMMFGPPGCGKSMAAYAASELIPDLDHEASIETTQIWSLAAKKRKEEFILRPPFRSPHHSSSREGLLGGGKDLNPGEISLAHNGILFLDETPEFGSKILQSLREPLENHIISLSRAGQSCWYPADFQLLMAVNPCPCGNLGKPDIPCSCRTTKISRYWKRMGGALLDRIDIRVPVSPVNPEILLEENSSPVTDVAIQLNCLKERQKKRFKHESFSWNSRIPVDKLKKYCSLTSENEKLLSEAALKTSLSSRAIHSILRVSRTIADLQDRSRINKNDLLKSISLRRFGDTDLFWTKI